MKSQPPVAEVQKPHDAREPISNKQLAVGNAREARVNLSIGFPFFESFQNMELTDCCVRSAQWFTLYITLCNMLFL